MEKKKEMSRGDISSPDWLCIKALSILLLFSGYPKDGGATVWAHRDRLLPGQSHDSFGSIIKKRRRTT